MDSPSSLVARAVYKSVGTHLTLILDENPSPNPDETTDHGDSEFAAGAASVKVQV